jgi:predicted nucleotidyltransferase
VPPITRETLIQTLHSALESLPDVDGAWLGGSAAFGKLDSYSDVDLFAVVADDSLERAFVVIEDALEASSPIALRYQIPNTVGFQQRVYSFRELHGDPVVLFDKSGIVRAIPMDRTADLAEAQRRLTTLKAGFTIFQHLTKKEISRGHAAEALLFYHGFTLRPLVEAVRIRHCPHRRVFHLRYLERDLPSEVASRLCHLSFVRDLDDLAVKRTEAEAWFWETVNAIAAA